jgi:phenol hydroxylase P4 protein
MPVRAITEYVGEVKDRLESFGGNQLLYVGWERHLMFCAPFAFPFPPDMRFGDVVEKVLPGAFGYHPDFARIDWSKVTWTRSGQPFTPDFSRSLRENGLAHKDAIQFRTPGLDGVAGSGS